MFDVACSGGEDPDPATGRCPENGATVDARTCKTTPGTGAAQIKGIWRDPAFDRKQRAFYYVQIGRAHV